jgi:hypothetical protein
MIKIYANCKAKEYHFYEYQRHYEGQTLLDINADWYEWKESKPEESHYR